MPKLPYEKPTVEVINIDDSIYEGEIMSNTRSPKIDFGSEGNGDDIAADEYLIFDWDNENWKGWDD